MSIITNAFDGKPQKLDYEVATKPTKPDALHLRDDKTTPSKFEVDRLSELKQKFSMSKLEFHGELQRRLETSLEDFSNEDARTRRPQQLATATVKGLNGKATRLWLEVSK